MRILQLEMNDFILIVRAGGADIEGRRDLGGTRGEGFCRDDGPEYGIHLSGGEGRDARSAVHSYDLDVFLDAAADFRQDGCIEAGRGSVGENHINGG